MDTGMASTTPCTFSDEGVDNAGLSRWKTTYCETCKRIREALVASKMFCFMLVVNLDVVEAWYPPPIWRNVGWSLVTTVFVEASRCAGLDDPLTCTCLGSCAFHLWPMCASLSDCEVSRCGTGVVVLGGQSQRRRSTLISSLDTGRIHRNKLGINERKWNMCGH